MKILIILILSFLSITKMYAQLPQIYVHTDRTIYTPGDTIWFKAYIMSDLKLDTSKVNLYINWGNVSGVVDQCNAYLVSEGYTFGQFVVPENFKYDHILLNAFTGDISSNPTLGFYKYIDIVTNELVTKKQVANTYSLKVNVVGDQIIRGVKNEIFMRSENSSGIPFEYEVELIDKNFQNLQTVKSDSIGLSSIQFVPNDEVYLVRWKNPSGEHQVLDLPIASNEGVKINISSDKEVYFASFKAVNLNIDTIKVVGRMNRSIIFEKEIYLSKDSARIQIPKSALSFGVLSIDVFNKTNSDAIASAFELINYEHILVESRVNILESNPVKKGKQRLQIVMPDGIGANMSISITDIDEKVEKSDHFLNAVVGSQFSNTYDFGNGLPKLSSWAKTVKRNIDYKFIDSFQLFKDYLLYVKGEVLMSEKKWKEYDNYIDKLASGKRKSKFLFNQNSLSIGFHPIKNDTINYPFMYDQVLLEKDRTFAYKKFQFFDTMEFKLSHVHRYTQYSDLEVKYLFKPFADYTTFYVPKAYADTLNYISNLELVVAADPNFIKNRLKGFHIETVTVLRKRKRSEVVEIEDLLNVSSFFKNSVEDILPQEDPYIQKYSVSIRGSLQHLIPKNRGKITYLNEVRLVSPQDFENLEEVMEYDASWFALLKVIQNAGGNELALYTFAPSNVNREIGRQIKKNKIMGYSSIANISNKTYEGVADLNVPDNRITLFWHPLIKWNGAGEHIEIAFYNNDSAQGYWVEIKGITTDGRVVDFRKKVMY